MNFLDNEIVIDCVAVLMGEYSLTRKQAAILLLKHYLPHDFLKFLLNSGDVYPFSRNDPRVRRWRKEILSIGKCEVCGNTERLEAHHIVKWADYPKGRADLANGMCLCHECHCYEHRFDSVFWMMKAKSKI